MKVLHAFNRPRSRGGSLANTLATIDVLRRLGAEVCVFDRDSAAVPPGILHKAATAIGALRPRDAVRAFERALDAFRPDIVHVNELFPLITAWTLPSCTARGIPVVMSCDDYHLTCAARTHCLAGKVCTRCMGGREWQAVLHRCKGNLLESSVSAVYVARLRRARLIQEHVAEYVTLSAFTHAWLVRHLGVAPQNVTVIPCLIELPRLPVADPARGRYFGFAGRFVPEKGVATLLHAARLADVPVRLSRNEDHFVRITLPPDADVVVTRGRDDLAEFYRGARALVVPSEWFETFGIVGAEAMSHGIPVIASRIGALANLVEDGVDGLLFEAGNAHDLAEKLARVWRDDALCRRLGAAARVKVSAQFRPDVQVARLLEVYERALRAGAGRGSAARAAPA